MAKDGTNSNCITCWPNLEPIQVPLYLAGEMTQVKESIPWVRCASGNVLIRLWLRVGIGVDQLSLLHNQLKETCFRAAVRPGGTPVRWMGAASTLGNEKYKYFTETYLACVILGGF